MYMRSHSVPSALDLDKNLAFTDIPGIAARCPHNGTGAFEELGMERLVVYTAGWGEAELGSGL